MLDLKELKALVREADLDIRTVDDGGKPFILLPDAMAVKDMEFLLPQPLRKKVNVSIGRQASFVDYVNEHKGAWSRIFAALDDSTCEIVCEIDYHEPNGIPAWREHVVSYTLRSAREWKEWVAMDNKRMTQQEFAEFIEEHVSDFETPKAAVMLELVRDFKATKKAVFESGVNLVNGDVRFTYSQETTPAKTTKANLDVPETFEISIPCFEGGEKIKVQAWFRYSVDEGVLSLRYKLQRPDIRRREQAEAVVAQIEEATKVKLYFGKV